MPDLMRKTRSGRAFSAWDGTHVIAAPDADLESLMKAACLRDDQADEGLLVDEEQDHNLCPVHPSPTPTPTPAPAPPQPYRSSLDPPPTPLFPIASSEPSSSSKSRRKAKQKAQGHRDRAAKRQATKDGVFSHHKSRDDTTNKYVSAENATISDWKVEKDARVAKTGYIGLTGNHRDGRTWTLEELVGPDSEMGFKLVPYKKGVSVPIVGGGEIKYVMGVIAGCPDDDGWNALVVEAVALLEDARRRCCIPSRETVHRRGEFATLRCGVSHGGGQTQPKNLSNRPVEEIVAAELNQKEPFKRFAGFANSVMATWAPKLYDHYVDSLGALHSHYPHLHRNFTSSVFAATTYNLGPQTACYRHVDSFNLPAGWCAITALGDYDYKLGGHLVLWELGLVIEFPPGTTILIPSAVVTHSNVGIRSHEHRYSFTQYTAGGIFRWVGNEFQKSTDFWDSLKDDPERRSVEEKKMQTRWATGLNMWMKFDELPTKK